MMEALLRGLHILAGVLWAGGGIYFMVVARRMHGDPAVRDRFHATGAHGPYMGLTSIATFGFGLAVLLQGTYDREALGGGFFLFHGALGLASLALVLGLAGHMPLDIRLKGLAQRKLAGQLDAAGTADYERLDARSDRLAHVSAGLIGLALLGMVLFRAFI
jgi:hypothetical protein